MRRGLRLGMRMIWASQPVEDILTCFLLGFAFLLLCSSTYDASQMENMGTSDDNAQCLCIVAASCDGKFSKDMASRTMHPAGREQDERGDSQ